MAGRFPLYTDADVRGPVIEALISRGWDVVRAIDAFPEGTFDWVHFEHAARLDRVLVANDRHMKAMAERWCAEGRSFRGLIWWPMETYACMTAGQFLERFEALAAQEQPFAPGYPIVVINPPR